MAWNDDAQANDESEQHWWRHDVNYSRYVIHVLLLKTVLTRTIINRNKVYDVDNISYIHVILIVITKKD